MEEKFGHNLPKGSASIGGGEISRTTIYLHQKKKPRTEQAPKPCGRHFVKNEEKEMEK